MKHYLLALFDLPHQSVDVWHAAELRFCRTARTDNGNGVTQPVLTTTGLPTGIVGIAADGSGIKHVPVATDGSLMINQNTVVDPLNSTVANIAAGASFVGTSTSDLNYTAVQYTIHADQNMIDLCRSKPRRFELGCG